MYFLSIEGNQNILSFFGEKGTITVNDQLEKFGIAPLIEGSNNQNIMEKYKKIASDL